MSMCDCWFWSGYALDPSVDTSQVSSNSYIGAVEEAEKNKGLIHIIQHLPSLFCIMFVFAMFRCYN